MNKIIRPLIYSLAITLLFIILIIVMVLLGYEPGIWILTAGILETSLGLIWLFIRMGMFSSLQYGMRRFANSSINRRNEKLGVYKEEKKKQYVKIKEFDSSLEVEKKSKEKNKWTIIFIISFGIILILTSLPWTI